MNIDDIGAVDSHTAAYMAAEEAENAPPSTTVQPPRALEVVVRELMEDERCPESRFMALASILQSRYESMKRIAENLSPSREEIEEMRRRRERLERLARLAEDREVDEREAEALMELLLSDEVDRALLEEQLAERAEAYA